MDTVFQALLSWQFILFCLGIAAITSVLRKGIEFFVLDNPKMPGTRTSKFWLNFVLPVSPVVMGPVLSYFAKQYPYPETLGNIDGRIAFGLVAGLFSGLAYRVLKSFMASKFGVVIDESDKKE